MQNITIVEMNRLRKWEEKKYKYVNLPKYFEVKWMV